MHSTYLKITLKAIDAAIQSGELNSLCEKGYRKNEPLDSIKKKGGQLISYPPMEKTRRLIGPFLDPQEITAW